MDGDIEAPELQPGKSSRKRKNQEFKNDSFKPKHFKKENGSNKKNKSFDKTKKPNKWSNHVSTAASENEPKEYDLAMLESKIAALQEIEEPVKKVRKKLRQLQHLQRKITQILMTQKTLNLLDESIKKSSEKENTDDVDDDDDNEDAASDDENEISDENGEISDEESEEKVSKKTKISDTKTQENLPKSDGETESDDDEINEKGTKRFVVFVGNLPKETKDDDIKQHFAKVGTIKSVRIPETKESRKNGFAFVELEDKIAYEKTLSMHHTMLNNKRINVMYTVPDGKNLDKKEIQKKNAKLDAMRKAGKLVGSTPEHQRRSFRRKKKRLAEAKAAENA